MNDDTKRIVEAIKLVSDELDLIALDMYRRGNIVYTYEEIKETADTLERLHGRLTGALQKEGI